MFMNCVMKKYVIIAAFSVCCAINAPADSQNQTLVVKVTDFSRRAAFELMSPDEFRTLQHRLAEEKIFYRKAFDLAERAWDADENNARKPFPSAAISIRKTSLIGRGFETREEARDKLLYYENKELRRRTSMQRKTEKK